MPLETFSQSFARAGHAAVYIPTSNTVYVFGGWNGKKYLNYGFLFDCQTSSVMLEKVQGRQVQHRATRL